MLRSCCSFSLTDSSSCFSAIWLCCSWLRRYSTWRKDTPMRPKQEGNEGTPAWSERGSRRLLGDSAPRRGHSRHVWQPCRSCMNAGSYEPFVTAMCHLRQVISVSGLLFARFGKTTRSSEGNSTPPLFWTDNDGQWRFAGSRRPGTRRTFSWCCCSTLTSSACNSVSTSAQ